MIFTRPQLALRSKSRPAGYAEAVLAASTPLADGKYELTDEAWEKLANQYRLPLTDGTGNRVAWRKKGCATCQPIVVETKQV